MPRSKVGRVRTRSVSSERIALDFPCVDPANVRESCVTQVIDTLGTRAFRRPIDVATRAELLASWRAEAPNEREHR